MGFLLTQALTRETHDPPVLWKNQTSIDLTWIPSRATGEPPFLKERQLQTATSSTPALGSHALGAPTGDGGAFLS